MQTETAITKKHNAMLVEPIRIIRFARLVFQRDAIKFDREYLFIFVAKVVIFLSTFVFMRYILFFILILMQVLTQASAQISAQASAQLGEYQFKQSQSDPGGVVLGIEMLQDYLPLLQGKKIAVVVNQTSVFPLRRANTPVPDEIKPQEQQHIRKNGHYPNGFCGAGTHLVDTLLSLRIRVKQIFSPEHGFRGNNEAGASIKNGIDSATGLPVISLYGKNKKPSLRSLKDIDVVVFDLQDVGARFYTYISTLQYVMEACAEAEIPLIVLDRPNPNGFYVDGPILDTSLRSFVGMQPVPIVYGMTTGEYARMLVGEKWVKGSVDLTVIPMKRYNRDITYPLAVAPSPNLSTASSILYYPSLCLFEGTVVSVGRGTRTPFMCYGFPKCPVGDFTFTPAAIKGVAENPPYKDIPCRGFILDRSEEKQARRGIMLEWIIDMYNVYPDKDSFFNSFFDKLAGTKTLRQQIRQGKTAEEIRASWKNDLEKFQMVRKKYLLYKDVADGGYLDGSGFNNENSGDDK
jgi:uncharacterized protein YbbC (DUF1343 family)